MASLVCENVQHPMASSNTEARMRKLQVLSTRIPAIGYSSSLPRALRQCAHRSSRRGWNLRSALKTETRLPTQTRGHLHPTLVKQTQSSMLALLGPNRSSYLISMENPTASVPANHLSFLAPAPKRLASRSNFLEGVVIGKLHEQFTSRSPHVRVSGFLGQYDYSGSATSFSFQNLMQILSSIFVNSSCNRRS